MEFSFSPDIRKYIEEQVNNGRYATPEELIHTALARLQWEEHMSKKQDVGARGSGATDE